jgi:perosamine synthetase
MVKIKKLAEEHDIKIIEDAAPSVGTEYYYKKTGGFGDIGCFSFQGAKILSTGEGGMIVTNDTELFNKIKHYAEHGRSGAGFDISDIGYKYKMSNLQAAMGLGQLERIDELVAKKREIYSWYRECLSDVDGVYLNKQMTDIEKPNYWMSSIILNGDFGIPRDEVMIQLKKRNIDSRSFFPPMSSFPMFDYYDNPIARYIGANGINLPSAHNLVHEDVKYVCGCLKDILQG